MIDLSDVARKYFYSKEIAFYGSTSNLYLVKNYSESVQQIKIEEAQIYQSKNYLFHSRK